ncbi:MAG: FtsK/SpoIIIE domain-containing protein [Ferrimicrobium sp.]
MNNNTTPPSSTMADEVLEILWQWRIELSIVSLIAIVYWGCARRVGYTWSAVIMALAVTALLCLPSIRRLLARTLRLTHWRRKFARALGSQSSPLAKRQPRVIKALRVPSGVRLTLSLQSGTAFQELEHLCPYLATHFGVRDVRVSVDRADASRVELTICSKDPFEDGPIPWPGVTGETVSAWDPISVGVDQDGNEVKLSLIERNLLIGGEPGSGKSVMLNVLIAYLARCSDVKLYLFDAKFVELRNWSQIASGFVGPNIDDAIAQLQRLRSVMEERYRFLDQQHARKLHRNHGLDLIVVVIDELPFYVANPDKSRAREFSDLLGDLITRGRAAGIIFVAAAQKPSADMLPSSIRDLINLRLAFRCSTKEASDTILGGGWASAGFSAATIGINNRGVGWLLGESGQPELIRGCFIDDATMAQLVEENGSRFQDKGGEDQ